LGGFDVGFVWRFVFLGRELVAKLAEAVEVFDGAAVEALGLGLEAKEGGGDIGLAVEDLKPWASQKARFWASGTRCFRRSRIV
jgi:hypothetical protein